LAELFAVFLSGGRKVRLAKRILEGNEKVGQMLSLAQRRNRLTIIEIK